MAERDLEQALQRVSQTQLSRRGFLAAAGLGGTAAALAACSGGVATSPSAPASVAASAAASAAESVAPTAAPSYEVEKQLFMYNWAEYISPKNIARFKKDFGVTKFQYDVYDNNEALIAKLQGGGTGYDIASPTAEYVPGMVEQGFVQKLDKSRLPSLANIDPNFKGL